jgi:acyl-CoA thioester hydrolase
MGTPEPSRVTLRVRYPEADRMGVAYHAHYLVWFELGRTELMREAGCPYGEVEDEQGIFFPVLEVGARYRRPARYDDRLVVVTTLSSVSGVRVRFDYVIEREGDGSILATGFTEHAAVSREGRPLRMPAALLARLATREARA